MKKSLSLLLSVVLGASLCGCSLVKEENNEILVNENIEIKEPESERAPEVQKPEEITESIPKMSEVEAEEYIEVFVRPAYNSINESEGYYEKTENDGVTVWKSGSQVMKKEIPAGVGGHDVSRQYYYDPESGELIFAFMFRGTEEHRLYFKSGVLFRYIDASGEIMHYPDVEKTNGLAEIALSEGH